MRLLGLMSICKSITGVGGGPELRTYHTHSTKERVWLLHLDPVKGWTLSIVIAWPCGPDTPCTSRTQKAENTWWTLGLQQGWVPRCWDCLPIFLLILFCYLKARLYPAASIWAPRQELSSSSLQHWSWVVILSAQILWTLPSAWYWNLLHSAW